MATGGYRSFRVHDPDNQCKSEGSQPMDTIKKYSMGGLACTEIKPSQTGKHFEFTISCESHPTKKAWLNTAEIDSLIAALDELKKVL